MTAPNDTVSISRSTSGPAGDASGAAAIFAVIATAAAGDANDPFLARNDRDPSEVYTGGLLPEFAEIISSYSRVATIPIRATSAVPGSYGSVSLDAIVDDVLEEDAFAGTCIPTADATYVPYIDSEVYVRFLTGGTLGDADEGITYQTSIAGPYGPFGPVTALGAATRIEVATAHARLDLTPPTAQQTQLVTHVNAVRTAALAHFLYTTGTVHGSADTTSDDGVGSAATNTATAITLEQQILAALALHLARGSTVHLVTQSGSSITAALAAATSAVAAAVASGTAQDAIVASIALEQALETHEASTVAHTVADATNVVSATRPTQGTVEADDVIQVPTFGPTMDDAGLAAAFAALEDFEDSKYGCVCIGGAFDPEVLWDALIAGLDSLRSSQVPVTCYIEARGPADGETEAQYRINLSAEWLAYHDERVHVVAGRGRYDPATLARCGSELYRSHLAPLCARLAALDYGESPGVVAASDRSATGPSVFGGPIAGFKMYDSAGARFGHDERKAPGLQPAGFGVVTSYRNAPDPKRAYVFQPKNRALSNNTAPHLTHQRVLTVVESVIWEVLTEELEQGLLYEPGRSTIRGDIADGLDTKIKSRILAATGDPSQTTAARISRLSALVDRNAVINPAAPAVPVYVEVDTRFYVQEFPVKLIANRVG